MNKNLFYAVDNDTIDLLNQTSQEAEENDVKYQKEQIKTQSIYSSSINNAFSGYEEFKYINSIGLKEANVTRRSLVRDIDFDLFITSKQKTNYELMMEGASPYAADDEDTVIILHHIGQAFDAPFAELTNEEHASFGNSKLLHSSKNESWRQDKQKLNAFQNEKIKYWQARAKNEIEFIKPQKEQDEISNYRQKDIITKIRQPLEKIFAACSIDDLSYISNLAQNYVFAKQIGVSTIEEYVLSLKNSKLTNCPYCHSRKISFYGYQETTFERKQRYRCKSCGRIFSAYNKSIVYGCNMSFIDWLKFIECLYNGYSLEKTASLCDISVPTAFDNRIKLFYALSILDRNVVLTDEVVIYETYLHVSYKGNKATPLYELNREPHKRGNDVHTPGLSKEQVCIVCAIDSKNKSVARVAGLGGPTAEKIDAALKSAIYPETISCLYSDCSYAIKKFAKMNALEIKQAQLIRKNKPQPQKAWVNKYINKVNSYHSRLKKFIASFNGVSTELLAGYLMLFAWKERTKHLEPIEAYKELLSVMVKPKLYKSVDQIISEKIIPSPFEMEQKAKPPKKIHNLERAHLIYAMWSRGVKMEDVGEKFGISKQRVHQIIVQYRQNGYAYMTDHEKKKLYMTTNLKRWEDKLAIKSQKLFQRNYEIYQLKQTWDKDDESFYLNASEKYGLAINSIKNCIARAKRVLALKKEFYVYEKYEHMTLEELFRSIFDRYEILVEENPDKPKNQIYDILSEEYGYTQSMIITIVQKMKNDTMNLDDRKVIRTPKSQILNRDIAIFIDFMNWSGLRKDFYQYVEDAYKIKPVTTSQILQMNYMADPERFKATRRS